MVAPLITSSLKGGLVFFMIQIIGGVYPNSLFIINALTPASPQPGRGV